MKKFLAAAAIVALSSASAFATEEKMKSTGDAPAASGQGQQTDKMTPGATGAMEKSTGGVATTPDEVKKQGGMATAPKGADDKAAPAGQPK